MDPATFGIVFVGATGGVLVVLAIMEEAGMVNESMLRLFMETAKYGGILVLMKHLWSVFF